MIQIQLSQTANVPDENDGVGINNNSKGSDDAKETPSRKLIDNNSDSSSEVEEQPQPKIFQVILDRPRPEGVRIARQNICFIEIVSNDDQLVAADEIQQKYINYLLEQKEVSWCDQFKVACMLGPQIDEDNQIEMPDCSEALLHFLSIGWKIFFSLIPPRRYGNGLPAFFVSLLFIGIVTAVVAEFATMFGCELDIKQPVTAITFVALGTSLPDTFASRTAAINSEHADSAVGNINGSNSVNVFLGLGLPWTIASVYNRVKYNRDYFVKTKAIGFSVIMFLLVSVVCFAILLLRRWVSLNCNY